MSKRTVNLTINLLIPGTLALLAFILYASTTAPTVLAADGGEFQFVPYILGLAHPTGYPLYLLLGWAWSHALPLGDVAYRMNLFSAFWAAAAVGLLYPAIQTFLELAAPASPPNNRRAAALCGAATLGLSQTFWSQAVIAEVYALNAFFVTLLLFILLNWAKSYQKRWWYALCLAYGFSLTHHRTVWLLIPAIAVFAWLTWRERPASRSLQARLKLGGVSLLLLLLPLLLYLYVPLRAPHTPYTIINLGENRQLVTYENSLQGFVNYVLGQMFSGEVGGWQQGLERLPLIWELLLAQFYGLFGIGLGIAGLARLLTTKRWPLALLTGLAYLAVVSFNAIYQIGDIFVFFIPSYIVFSLWLSLGVLTAAQGAAEGVTNLRSLLRRSEAQGYGRIIGVISALLTYVVLILHLALPGALLSLNLPLVDRHDDFAARDAWQEILAEPLPVGAVLVSNDRDEIMPMWYYQYVEGRRSDLLGLFPRIVDDKNFDNIGGVVDAALDAGRQVFLAKPMPGLEIKYNMERQGAVVRVLESAIEKPPARPREIILGDAVRLVGYDQSPHSLQPGGELRVTLYWQAQRRLRKVFASYVHLVDEAGNGVTQSDHVPGGVYYPTPLWRPGETLRDRHLLTLPADVPPGSYRLLVGMYEAESQEPLGQGDFVGQVAVKTEVVREPGKIEHPLQANFDSKIALLGYDLEQSGDELRLTLHWQAERPLNADYTVFVHLLDQDGEIVAQQDGQPGQGTYPTSVWDEGEVVSTRHTLRIDPKLPAGKYTLAAGWYLLETGVRLPVLDEAGRAVDDRMLLGQVEW
jgi:hypothetical protein